MSTTTDLVRAHYDGPGLSDRIKSALAAVAPEDRPLTVAQLATLDQFHTRGILATAELASAAVLKSGDAVLDLGCGVGGPARYLAATFGCTVAGVDLSPSFIEAATYLTRRCGLDGQVAFRVGDALDLPFDDGAFDVVFLQHVAMNIANRPALYAEVRRVLKPGGRFAIYDLVLAGGDVVYPAPWARDASASFPSERGGHAGRARRCRVHRDPVARRHSDRARLVQGRRREGPAGRAQSRHGHGGRLPPPSPATSAATSAKVASACSRLFSPD